MHVAPDVSAIIHATINDDVTPTGSTIRRTDHRKLEYTRFPRQFLFFELYRIPFTARFIRSTREVLDHIYRGSKRLSERGLTDRSGYFLLRLDFKRASVLSPLPKRRINDGSAEAARTEPSLRVRWLGSARSSFLPLVRFARFITAPVYLRRCNIHVAPRAAPISPSPPLFSIARTKKRI